MGFFQMSVSRLAYITTFSRQPSFEKVSSSHFFRVTTLTQNSIFWSSYFFRVAAFLRSSFFRKVLVKEIVETWLIYVNKFSWFIQSYFLTETIKRASLVLASFSYFLENFHLAKVIVITVVFSIHSKETN